MLEKKGVHPNPQVLFLLIIGSYEQNGAGTTPLSQEKRLKVGQGEGLAPNHQQLVSEPKPGAVTGKTSSRRCPCLQAFRIRPPFSEEQLGFPRLTRENLVINYWLQTGKLELIIWTDLIATTTLLKLNKTTTTLKCTKPFKGIT